MPDEPLGESFQIHLKTAYARFERPISSISLLGGFAFDAMTLKRVDMFWENLWVVVHLAVVGACILLVNRAENRGFDRKDPSKPHFWLLNALQFSFGGLLSTFLVFYFRSGNLWVSWPFFLILGGAFLANENIQRHHSRLYFQLSIFFLSLFCFAIFFLPILLHRIGPFVFLLSGAATLVLFYLFILLLRSFGAESLDAERPTLFKIIGATFIAINALYFLNVIPPLPLSLQDAAVYHSVTRDAGGNYIVQSEEPERLHFLRLVETFHATSGASVYAYTAIFSPTSLNTKIVHEWQFYEPTRGWTNMGNGVALDVRGGRGGGYRTFSMRPGITPGAWRVNVETPSGGRLRFNVLLQPSDPSLVNQVKN